MSLPPKGLAILIGPSGCGKSTLVRSLSLLELPDSGVVEIDEESYEFPRDRKRSDIAPWPKVTVVFQQHFLWPHLTLEENILLPIRRLQDPRPRVAALAEAFDMTRSVLARYPSEVSIGQRQRAALIRGLALNPSYILLDEITAALDVEQTGKILRYFLEEEARGLGVLIVTHLLGFAKRLISVRGGGSIFFMAGGTIVEKGGVEILTSPGSERLKRFLTAGSAVV